MCRCPVPTELNLSEINATGDDGLLRLETSVSKTHPLSSTMSPVSVKGNGWTSVIKALWATASAFKVTFHVRDRRWWNRVDLNMAIREMLAGTQTSFLLDGLTWAITSLSGPHVLPVYTGLL